MTETIIILQNIRQVIKTEKWCVNNLVDHKIVPVPKEYSSECGMCILIQSEIPESLISYLEESNFTFQIKDYKTA
ncbi:DUF3343 domain-containing protein [Puteibacter caeruleilacunae]|nr:DUF3343 domain-containing protein [Puteibacter caeruleilacunae]